jgi:REP element-mobilizing transposase RayT
MLERFKWQPKVIPETKLSVWQYGNHPEVYSNKFMWSKLDYIHLNPVRAGIVEKASHYVYSSASNYVSDSGLLKIEKQILNC